MTIQHTVVFRLATPATNAEFVADAERILSAIPGVKDFSARRQVSPKSDLQIQFSMFFDSDAEYQAYNDHPDHVTFVESRWKTEVADFQEYDFVTLGS